MNECASTTRTGAPPVKSRYRYFRETDHFAPDFQDKPLTREMGERRGSLGVRALTFKRLESPTSGVFVSPGAAHRVEGRPRTGSMWQWVRPRVRSCSNARSMRSLLTWQ